MKSLSLILLAIILAGCGTTTGNYGTTFLVQGTPTENFFSRAARSLILPSPDQWLQASSNMIASLNQSSSVRASLHESHRTTITVTNKDGSTGGELNLTEAKMALKEISFKKEKEIEAELEVKYQGPYVVDLLNNTATPSFSNITLDPGEYDKIQMKLAKVEEGLAPSDHLYERSIYLEGTYTGPTGNSGNVTDTPFTLVFETDDEFDLTAAAKSFSIAANTSNTIIVALRMNRWLAFNASENDEAEDFSDVIVSATDSNLSKDSASTNHKIWQTIRKLLKASARFGKDSDNSGKLEDNEDDD